MRLDLQGDSLIGDMEECKMALFNLILNGLAIPYLHNGQNYYNADSESLVN